MEAPESSKPLLEEYAHDQVWSSVRGFQMQDPLALPAPASELDVRLDGDQID